MADYSRERGESGDTAALKPLGEEIREAVDHIGRLTRHTPRAAIILGSGLAPVAELVRQADVIYYGDIPHFPKVTVEGHPGKLAIGEIEGVPVAVMVGRAHFYEGYSMSRLAFPVRALRRLGCEVLVVTNAAGGISPSLHPGDVMLIEDHLNLPSMAGFSPVSGAHDLELGPRFVSMGRAYDHELSRLALAAAGNVGLDLKRGVYAMVGGPAYETEAEIRFLRAIGADAVGMSTAPEVIVARQEGMRVLGLSCIANVAHAPSHAALSHEDVLASIGKITPKLGALLGEVLVEWARRTT